MVSRAVVVVVLTCSLFALAAPAQHVSIQVDASEACRSIFHARLEIPAKAGTLVLYYPKWIPGQHGPTGPIQDLAGLKFAANGQTLKWRRDLLDAWTFRVDVPATSMVEASLDFVSPVGVAGLRAGGRSATEKMTVLNWNTLLLYPAGWTSNELIYEATLRLPVGWKFSTSLSVASRSGGDIQFTPVSLAVLVDSPVITSQYLREVHLAGDPVQELDIAADSADALEAPMVVIGHYRNLTVQAQKLFGSHHFREYHFLYALSDYIEHFGREHQESSDIRRPEHTLSDPKLLLLAAGVAPHEYVHSWNGKYRRPADLTAEDYQKPVQTDLLWVYEGLSSYLGDILSVRSGLRTPQEFRDLWALVAAELDHRPGRSWRNLQDTLDGMPSMQGAPDEWNSWRRHDFYDEEKLDWLWADTIIRQQTRGQKSIDDFCHLFYGGPDVPPIVNTYTFDDVINALYQVAPYDWRAFWTERLTNHGSEAPLQGIQGAGWKLVYDETQSEQVKAREDVRKETNASFSIGLRLRDDGTIVDTIEGATAARVGIGPGMKVVTVDGRPFSKDVFRNALKAGKETSEPLQLIIENTGYYKVYKLDYHGGEKYPHLERIASMRDLLSDIIAPK